MNRTATPRQQAASNTPTGHARDSQTPVYAVESPTQDQNVERPGASSVSGARSGDGCKQPTSIPEDFTAAFGDGLPDRVYRSVGCPDCRGTGYRGRIGVYELLSMDQRLRRLLYAKASEDELQSAALENGLVTLREQALHLIRDGETTLDEVIRVFQDLSAPRIERSARTKPRIHRKKTATSAA